MPQKKRSKPKIPAKKSVYKRPVKPPVPKNKPKKRTTLGCSKKRKVQCMNSSSCEWTVGKGCKNRSRSYLLKLGKSISKQSKSKSKSQSGSSSLSSSSSRKRSSRRSTTSSMIQNLDSSASYRPAKKSPSSVSWVSDSPARMSYVSPKQKRK